MPNTTNFNWPTPADTDLVKDGAAAIRNLGNGIDTSLIDLKGGTTGQILSKASNADMDFTFITPNVGDITEVQAGVGISVASGTGPIPIITNSSTDLITTAGDLLYGTAADTVARLGIGTAGQVLKVNSGATAPEWGAAGGAAGLTLITNQSFTTVSSYSLPASTFTTTYNNYEIHLDITAFSASNTFTGRLRSGSTDLADNDYQNNELKQNGVTVSTGDATQTSLPIGDVNSNTNYQMKMTLFKPMLATKKWYMLQRFHYTQAGVWQQVLGSGRIDDAGTFDSFSFIPGSGTITGRVYVYGYSI